MLMQDILELLKNRRSIRSYKPDAIPDELLNRVLEAGLYAPTGMGRQEVIILKITKEEVVRKLGYINGELMGKSGFDAFYGAPAVLCVLADTDVPTAVFDGCSVISGMLAEATSLGLGTCWVHRGREQFETPEGQKILQSAGIDPARYIGIDNLAIGYAEGPVPKAAPRKPGRIFSIE